MLEMQCGVYIHVFLCTGEQNVNEMPKIKMQFLPERNSWFHMHRGVKDPDRCTNAFFIVVFTLILIMLLARISGRFTYHTCSSGGAPSEFRCQRANRL